MKTFQATIIGDKYPLTFTTEGSSWSVGVSRAIKQWQKRFKGSRTKVLKIRVVTQ